MADLRSQHLPISHIHDHSRRLVAWAANNNGDETLEYQTEFLPYFQNLGYDESQIAAEWGRLVNGSAEPNTFGVPGVYDAARAGVTVVAFRGVYWLTPSEDESSIYDYIALDPIKEYERDSWLINLGLPVALGAAEEFALSDEKLTPFWMRGVDFALTSGEHFTVVVVDRVAFSGLALTELVGWGAAVFFENPEIAIKATEAVNLARKVDVVAVWGGTMIGQSVLDDLGNAAIDWWHSE